METDHSKWFLVFTKAREEKRAKKHLENQGFEVMLPIIAFEEINQPESLVLETMFPRYLFVKINMKSDNWTIIKSTRGVSHLVIFGQKLAEVPSEVIVFLKKKTAGDGIFKHKITRQEFQKGDKLVIKKGILKGKEAIFVSKKSNKRVQVLLTFINQMITAEISVSDTGKKEIIEPFRL